MNSSNHKNYSLVLKIFAHHVKILKPGPHSLHHVLSLGVRWRTWVQTRVEARAHLLDAGLQLFTLEERYEHCLVDLITLETD